MNDVAERHDTACSASGQSVAPCFECASNVTNSMLTTSQTDSADTSGVSGVHNSHAMLLHKFQDVACLARTVQLDKTLQSRSTMRLSQQLGSLLMLSHESDFAQGVLRFCSSPHKVLQADPWYSSLLYPKSHSFRSGLSDSSISRVFSSLISLLAIPICSREVKNLPSTLHTVKLQTRSHCHGRRKYHYSVVNLHGWMQEVKHSQIGSRLHHKCML